MRLERRLKEVNRALLGSGRLRRLSGGLQGAVLCPAQATLHCQARLG
jgi:hypothetical protein